jgi:hypothetical protein
MFDLLFIASIVGTIGSLIKETFTPEIPAENWANKELYHKDIIDGVPIEQCLKNLENGKYKLTELHPKPHRDPISGKIIIENCKLYHEDLIKYGAYQAQKWIKQGRYNLSPEELKKERERIKAELEYSYKL